MATARYPVSRRTIVSVPRLELFHRGFALRIEQVQDGSDGYAFRIESRGLALHTSGADYRTPQSAERAARLFVDDALGGFEHATRALHAS